MKETEAYKSGFDAGFNGTDEKNPYPKDSSEYREWETGHNEGWVNS